MIVWLCTWFTTMLLLCLHTWVWSNKLSQFRSNLGLFCCVNSEFLGPFKAFFIILYADTSDWTYCLTTVGSSEAFVTVSRLENLNRSNLFLLLFLDFSINLRTIFNVACLSLMFTILSIFFNSFRCLMFAIKSLICVVVVCWCVFHLAIKGGLTVVFTSLSVNITLLNFLHKFIVTCCRIHL